MSFAPESDTRIAEAQIRPDAFLRAPLGFSSPLWVYFAGAAMTGATWWWMTRWARPQNLEAMFGAAEAALEAAVEAEVEQVAALAAPAIEVLEAVEEALAGGETVSMAQALDEALDYPPVGGESGPFSPVLEAIEPEVVEAAAIEATHIELAAAEPAIVEAAPVASAPVEPAALEAAAAPKPRRKAAAPPAAETAD